MKKESIFNLLKSKFGFIDKEAIGLILSGKVIVNGTTITKQGTKIDINAEIKIKEKEKYVSRGAYKLIDALDSFKIDVSEKVCMDVGSSTGGFTEVLLERGAKKVIAIDCGKNQLDYKLRCDKRVILIENKKVTLLKKEEIVDDIEIVVMDVSFTSSVKILEYLFQEFLIKKLIVLIKPQFEYNRLKKKLLLPDSFDGVIKDSLTREQIVNYIENEIKNLKLNIVNKKECNIKGTKGNIEYLFYIKR